MRLTHRPSDAPSDMPRIAASGSAGDPRRSFSYASGLLDRISRFAGDLRRFAFVGSLLFFLLIGTLLHGDITRSEAISMNLSVEHRLLQSDMEAFSALSDSLNHEMDRFKTLQGNLNQTLQAEDVSANDIMSLVSQIQAQWSYVEALQVQLSRMSQGIAGRLERIEALEAEKASARQQEKREDPLSGKWKVTINPNNQEGTFVLKLSTTIVQGHYELSGNWTGSLRGTLIGDVLRLERIDSEKGFIAVYYGRLKKEEETITGTWQSTRFTTGGPMTGTWSATKINEP